MGGQVKVNNRTRDAVQQIRGLSRQGLREFAETMLDHAQDHPDAGGAPIDTGNLSRTLNFDEPKFGELRIFSQTGYGLWVHEGHQTRNGGNVPANPFFARAASKTITEFQDGDKWGE